MTERFKHIIAGDDLEIGKKLRVRNMTLREIKDFGETRYNSLVGLITLRPIDVAVMLYDSKLDYRTISDFEFFLKFTRHTITDIEFLIPALDMRRMQIGIKPASDPQEIVLYNSKGIVIDQHVFMQITDFVRKTHYISTNKDVLHPGVVVDDSCESVYKQFISDMRRLKRRQAKNGATDFYADLISSVVNSEGSAYTYESAMDMHVSQLWDSFFRISRIMNFKQIMTGVYSGCVDYDKLDKNILNWCGTIDMNYVPRADDSKAVLATEHR